jgi:hypothetical protein
MCRIIGMVCLPHFAALVYFNDLAGTAADSLGESSRVLSCHRTPSAEVCLPNMYGVLPRFGLVPLPFQLFVSEPCTSVAILAQAARQRCVKVHAIYTLLACHSDARP